MVDDPNTSTGTAPKRQGVQALERAVQILRAIAERPGGLRFSELAARVNLPKATLYRLVASLTDEHFVSVGAMDRLQIGSGIAALAEASFNGTVNRLWPLMDRMRTELGGSVELAVLDGASVRTVARAELPHLQCAGSTVGLRLPLHCTASGKALLAAMARPDAARLMPERLDSLTPRTITDPGWFRHEVEMARLRGVAIERQEHSLGTCAVSAVVSEADHVVGAISVQVPAQDFDDRVDELAAAVRRACREATSLLTQ